MKTKLIWITTTLFVLIAAVIGAVFFYQDGKKIDHTDLNKLTTEAIKIEETGRKMISETEGEVYFDVTIPDFTEIYCEVAENAKSREDVFKSLEKALKKGKYETVTHKMTAKRTVENGEEVIHTEEALDALLENVLIEAVNKAMEVRRDA